MTSELLTCQKVILLSKKKNVRCYINEILYKYLLYFSLRNTFECTQKLQLPKEIHQNRSLTLVCLNGYLFPQKVHPNFSGPSRFL